MDNATYGEVIVAKESLINKRGSALTIFRKNNVGYVFQQYGLLPNLTVRENVEIGSNLQNDKDKKLPIDELLQTIGMYEYRNKFPYELSGGQQQRVSIARSLAKNPNLLFGDEPTGAVDEKTSKEILQLFKEVNNKFGNTVIIVTHNPLIAKLATTVIKVNNGKIEKVIKNNNPKTVDQVD
jgi:putative ABC transport system ATP-binding protein